MTRSAAVALLFIVGRERAGSSRCDHGDDID
jgi:hypothetical protein